MPRFEISREADEDLLDIYAYGHVTFGEAQADRYQEALRHAFELLAEMPLMGMSLEDVMPGTRRHFCRQHVIIYAPAVEGVYIIRVLHGNSDYLRRLLGEAGD